MPETPTQEVERFVISTGTNGVCRPAPDGAFVKFEDHQRLLRAVEEERNRLHKALAEGHGVEDGGIWEDRAKAAESQLEKKNTDWEEAARLALRRKSVIEGVEEDLERENENKVGARDARRSDTSDFGKATIARLDGEAYGLRLALQLLRDKGTEQGGGEPKCLRCGGDGEETYDDQTVPCGDCDGTGERRIPCEYCERSGHVENGPPGATYSAPCPRCHGRGYSISTQQPEVAVEQGGDADDRAASDRARGRTSEAPQGRHVAEAGVAVEGDPGLEQLLGWVEERISEREERPDSVLDSERTAFEAVLHRIRELQGERGEGE